MLRCDFILFPAQASETEIEIEAEEDDLLSIFDEATSGEQTNPTYVGCFKDSAKRVFAHESDVPGSAVSPATCNAWAASKGYKYFGMQVGNQCFGGDKYDTLGKANNCNSPVRALTTHSRKKNVGLVHFSLTWPIFIPVVRPPQCNGDKKQKCGGGWANSVYKTLVLPTPTYVGCFKDSAKRVFAHESDVPGASVSPATCNAWAMSHGYPYFGMQVGNQCFGGDKYDTLGKANNCNSQVCSRAHSIIA